MSDVVVRFENVGKMYKIFSSRSDHLLDAIGFQGLTRRRSERYREFWALRGIDFELQRGERLGIIGRNGAGKSTLLKLVTGNLPITEGNAVVQGEVQALLEIGGGLHPEFTGRENIRASLSFLGLSGAEIGEAEKSIAGFTELGRFLDQPFKTYSQGMQARLSFAIATTVQPDVLIVDEILGAGDAYFFSRSTRRMRELMDGGASVLLVTHALDQIIRFCDETIWLDRGRIVMRGASTEVIKSYEKFIRELEDRRLLATNRKASSGDYDAFERESYTHQLTVDLHATDTAEISELSLLRDGEVEDRIAVGDAQDGDTSQSGFVVLDSGAWSAPTPQSNSGYLRKLERTTGALLFNLWFYYPDSAYAVAVTYRADAPLDVVVKRGSTPIATASLPASAGWRTERLVLSETPEEALPHRAHDPERRRISHWPGEGSLRIADVRLLDADARERAIFPVGSTLSIVVRFDAPRAGEYMFVPAVTIYRTDGVLVSNHAGESRLATVGTGETLEFRLQFPTINLGNGRYLISVALFRTLSHVDESELYDLVDRSYEFEVTGNEAFDNGVFSHPAEWIFVGGEIEYLNASAGTVRST